MTLAATQNSAKPLAQLGAWLIDAEPRLVYRRLLRLNDREVSLWTEPLVDAAEVLCGIDPFQRRSAAHPGAQAIIDLVSRRNARGFLTYTKRDVAALFGLFFLATSRVRSAQLSQASKMFLGEFATSVGIDGSEGGDRLEEKVRRHFARHPVHPGLIDALQRTS